MIRWDARRFAAKVVGLATGVSLWHTYVTPARRDKCSLLRVISTFCDSCREAGYGVTFSDFVYGIVVQDYY